MAVRRALFFASRQGKTQRYFQFFARGTGWENAMAFSVFCTVQQAGENAPAFSVFGITELAGKNHKGKASREDCLFSSRHRQENGKWQRILLNEIDYRREKNGTFNSR
jgi:hypothetical protein